MAEKHRSAESRYRKQRLHRIKVRDIIRAAKDFPCRDCGRSFPHYVMDLDHRPGEEKLFQLGTPKYSIRLVLAEIKKCDPVCANCHRERTHRQEIAAGKSTIRGMFDA